MGGTFLHFSSKVKKFHLLQCLKLKACANPETSSSVNEPHQRLKDSLIIETMHAQILIRCRTFVAGRVTMRVENS